LFKRNTREKGLWQETVNDDDDDDVDDDDDYSTTTTTTMTVTVTIMTTTTTITMTTTTTTTDVWMPSDHKKTSQLAVLQWCNLKAVLPYLKTICKQTQY
jgi:hypothetical protein